ncbi:hypothetical protein CNR22_18790 [Sphingobacteriaceae bacterium]|nr:hypothetical protein CNR22_18790 [Sphingobacteriaceae bacterium]
MIKLNISRILVPFDFSFTAKKAIRHAALLAKANKGELVLLYLSKPRSFINMGLSQAELRQMAEEKKNYEIQMEETAAEVREEYAIPVKVLVKTGRHVSGISKFCEKNNVGLIVMGTEGFESVSNLLSGSNSHKVVSKSTLPVITIRSESHSAGYSNILVPIDLSEHTRQKMIIAIQVAKLFGANIDLLGLLVKGDAEDEFRLRQIMHQIEKRLQEEELPYSTELIKTDSPALRTLAAAKRKNADLIVTMTDQDSGSSSLISRSYVRELVDDSEIPVLSIPPETHDENIEPASIGGLW